MKLITRPRETNFKFLQVIGTLFIVAAMLVLVFALFAIVTSFLPSDGIGFGSIWAVFTLLYSVPLLLCGHLLHWCVAMWEAKQESTKILIELRKDLQHNNTLKVAPSGPDA